MGTYNRGGFGRGRDDRGFSGGGFRRGGGGFSAKGGPASGWGNRDDRQMFDAVCDNCGKPCKVPFQPTQGKPVYCSQCFEDKGGGTDRGDRGGRRDSRPSNGGGDQYKAQFEALNTKLDKLIAILTPKVEEAKPVVVKKIAKKKVAVKKEASVKEG